MSSNALSRRSLRLSTLVLPVAILAAGCSTEDRVLAPTSEPVPELLVAPQRGVEQPGFAFLAPVGYWVPGRPAGEFDGSLLAQLKVEVCEWTGTACKSPLLKRFSAGSGLTVVDAEYRNLYRALWLTPSKASELGKTFRIRALVGSTELGHADVKLVRWLTVLTDGEPISGSGKVPLGAPVPIRFFVTRGTVGSIGSGGGAVELAGGQVRLSLPAGAVTTTIPITAMPAIDLPAGGPAFVPGTAWDFGPDGQVFSKPVTMTIKYDPALLPAGVAEKDLRIHKLVNGSYKQQDAGAVDLANKTVSAQVTGFSVYVVLPRVPGREEDLSGPVITGVEVFNPATGAWDATATLDVSAAAATYRFRVAAQDDISGVQSIGIGIVSPSGAQRRSCFSTGAPISGSDTQGIWECTGTFERYLEPGPWTLYALSATDVVRNNSGYSRVDPRFERFCKGAQCVFPTPTVTVQSNPWDGTAPAVTGNPDVSLDVNPRSYGQTVTIDATTTSRSAIVRIPFSDDLAGISPSTVVRFERVGGGGTAVGAGCQLFGSLSGTLECSVFFPQQAPTGTYRLSILNIQDRTGNAATYSAQPDGRLCTAGAVSCLGARPEVEVVGLGDSDAPRLQTLQIVEDGGQVTTSVTVTENMSGFNYLGVLYLSTTSTQIVGCDARPAQPAGTGSASCAFTFNPAAARGQWVLRLRLADTAGNERAYTRRPSDGFLCYLDPATQQQDCRDFGDTDLLLP